MTARQGATATSRSRFVPRCAKWLICGFAATACLNPWPDEYPQTTSVRDDSPDPGDNVNAPGAVSNPDPISVPDTEAQNDIEGASGAGGSSAGPVGDAGAPPPDAGATTATTTRLRGLIDAGADAQ